MNEQNDLEIDNLPNRITIFRVLMIPIVIGCLFIVGLESDAITQEQRSLFGWAAAWVFTVACITDFFDGYIARKRNIVTVFGSFLDPIADKFITVSSLIMLLSLGRIEAIVVIILVVREMYMTSLRLLAMNEGISVPVNDLGKWKTATMMVGIPMLMCNEQWFFIPFPQVGIIFIYIASIISLWSAVLYSFSMVQKLKADRQAKREARKQRKEEKKLQKKAAKDLKNV
jgi:CDP-diacylglycerol--glycerol-3-phosphate 3-phosphatidyltransferase